MKRSAHQMQTIHPKENAAWFQKKRTSFSKEHGVTEFCSLGNAKIPLKTDFHKTYLQRVILSLPHLGNFYLWNASRGASNTHSMQVFSKGYDPKVLWL